MAKHSNLEVLNFIKLRQNSVIASETTNDSKFGQIKYDSVSGTWVYKNHDETDWHKFSDANSYIIYCQDFPTADIVPSTLYITTGGIVRYYSDNSSFINLNDIDVEYVDEFLESGGDKNKLYITNQGQSKFWNSETSSYINTSIEVTDEISTEIPECIPNVSAVINYTTTNFNNTEILSGHGINILSSVTNNHGIFNKQYTLSADTDYITKTISGSIISAANIKLTKDVSSEYAAVYHLSVDGSNAGTINIPKDQFLSGVSYILSSNSLEFTFTINKKDINGATTTEAQTIQVPVTSFISEYSAGSGIYLNTATNEFSVYVQDNDNFLTQTISGIQLSGVQNAIDNAYISAITSTQIMFANNISGNADNIAFFSETSGKVQDKNISIVSTMTETNVVKTNVPNINAVINYVSGYVENLNTQQIFYNVVTSDIATGLIINSNDGTAVYKSGDIITPIQQKIDIASSIQVSDISTFSYLPNVSAVINYVTGFVDPDHAVYYITNSFDEYEPTDKTLTGLYINTSGQSMFWDGEKYISISYPVVSKITNGTPLSALPNVEAITSYISSILPEEPNAITYIVSSDENSGISVTSGTSEQTDTEIIYKISADYDNILSNISSKFNINKEIDDNNNETTYTLEIDGIQVADSIVIYNSYSNVPEAVSSGNTEANAVSSFVDSKTSGFLQLEILSQEINNNNSQIFETNTLYVDSKNRCSVLPNDATTTSGTWEAVSGNLKDLSMPVVTAIADGYITNQYIPSVKAVVDYITQTTAAATVSVTDELDEETSSSEVFLNKLSPGTSGDNFDWTNMSELIITHNLGIQYPTVSIFSYVEGQTKLTHTNLSWYVIEGDANSIYIDCSQYTDKLLTIKITK